MKNYIVLFLTVLIFSSCNFESRKPEFKKIKNVKVVNFSINNTVITADAILYNPNGVSIFLNKTEVDIFANDIKVSHVSQTENTEITKKSEFKIPLKAKFKLSDLVKDKSSILDIITSGINTLEDQTIDLRYVGFATFQLAGVEIEIPIDYEESVELKK